MLLKEWTFLKLFDLHCDTLFRALDEKSGIIDNDYQLSVLRGRKYDAWVQCFAIWIPDEYRGDAAISLFKRAKKLFDREVEINSDLICRCENTDDIKNAIDTHKCAAILTVEGGAALAGDIKNLDYLHDCGVKMMTLTWNDSCELGGGSLAKAPNDGITDFGKSVVRRMTELSMAIDISHASDTLFFDVASAVDAPLVASHSNSRAVYLHRRNLTDEQFNVIKARGGLVGLNFARQFLSDGDSANGYDILRHAEHFLALGGEKVVCLGTDFDGADVIDDVPCIERMDVLYELFLRHNYSEGLVEDIFFYNAFDFFARLG